jgi:hypothetical protein
MMKPYNDPTSNTDLASIKTSNSKQHIIDTFGIPSTAVQANSTSPLLSSSDVAVIVQTNKQQKQRLTALSAASTAASTAAARATTNADEGEQSGVPDDEMTQQLKPHQQDLKHASTSGQPKPQAVPLSTLARMDIKQAKVANANPATSPRVFPLAFLSASDHWSTTDTKSIATCVCDAGYTGTQCKTKLCPLLCSGHGICQDDGICDCSTGFGGEGCDMAFYNCPKNCNGHGVCTELEHINRTRHHSCICHQGFSGEACDLELCDPLCLHGA